MEESICNRMRGAHSISNFVRCSEPDNDNTVSCKGYVRFSSAENTCYDFCKNLGYTCYEAYKEKYNDASCLIRNEKKLDCFGPPNDDFVCGCKKGKHIIVRICLTYNK